MAAVGLPPDAAGEGQVLGLHGHALGVDGARVGVLKQAHQVRLRALLQRQDGRALEADLAVKPAVVANAVVGDLPHEALEGRLAQELRGGGGRKSNARGGARGVRVGARGGARGVRGAGRGRGRTRSVPLWYLRISRSATVPGR